MFLVHDVACDVSTSKLLDLCVMLGIGTVSGHMKCGIQLEMSVFALDSSSHSPKDWLCDLLFGQDD